MRVRNVILGITIVAVIGMSQASADSAKPGQSMTHMKTAAGLTSLLESAGVILYVQGGATSAIMGESISSPDGQIVFHIPVTANKSGVQHIGSNIVFFNTANNKQVQLRNPVINLATGEVTAVVPQAENKSMAILKITNATTLKAAITNDRKASLRTTAYKGATLVLAPGISGALTSLLELPAGSLSDGATFGSADVSLYSKLAKK